MMTGHGRTVYACGHVREQCRCPGPHHVTTLRERCPACEETAQKQATWVYPPPFTVRLSATSDLTVGREEFVISRPDYDDLIKRLREAEQQRDTAQASYDGCFEGIRNLAVALGEHAGARPITPKAFFEQLIDKASELRCRYEGAERELARLDQEAVAVLAQFIETPERGYRPEPWLLRRDIERAVGVGAVKEAR